MRSIHAARHGISSYTKLHVLWPRPRLQSVPQTLRTSTLCPYKCPLLPKSKISNPQLFANVFWNGILVNEDVIRLVLHERLADVPDALVV